jgi:hypothetical protein
VTNESVVSGTVPLIVLAGVREEATDLAAVAVACSLPSPVILRYRLDPEHKTLYRSAAAVAGMIDEQQVPLAGGCLTCALREDAVQILRRLASREDCGAVVLRLPRPAAG